MARNSGSGEASRRSTQGRAWPQSSQPRAAACLLARFVPNLPLFPTGAPVRRQLDLF